MVAISCATCLTHSSPDKPRTTRLRQSRHTYWKKYNADSLVDFINTRGLQDEVDLVEGGHITLLRTEQEETDARNDYEAAKAAGLIVEGVRWLGNEELQKVSFLP